VIGSPRFHPQAEHAVRLVTHARLRHASTLTSSMIGRTAPSRRRPALSRNHRAPARRGPADPFDLPARCRRPGRYRPVHHRRRHRLRPDPPARRRVAARPTPPF
jgi:hypothetical protein